MVKMLWWTGGCNDPASGKTYLILPYTSAEDSGRGVLLLLGLSLIISVTFISVYSDPGHGTTTLHLNPLCQRACSSAGPRFLLPSALLLEINFNSRI